MNTNTTFRASMFGTALAAAALFVGTQANAGTVLIDGFEDVTDVTTSGSLVPVSDTYVPSTASIGSTVTVTVSPIPPEVEASVEGAMDGGSQVAALSADFGGEPSFVFAYELDEPLDLTNFTDFELDIFSLTGEGEEPNVDFTVAVSSDGVTFADLTNNFGDPSGSGVLSFFLFDFAGLFDDPAVDETAITDILLTITTNSEADDFAIDNFRLTVVPSPTAAGFGILGLIALVGRRRK
ncbi:MAG: hypothetical protein AAF823_09150 [Planctomycetota bacterium]